MQRSIEWRGVFAVLVTPFRQDLSIDVDGLRRQVKFCVACGARVVVGPVVASEFFTLSDEERRLFYRVTAEELEGEIPFVAGVSGTSAPHAVELAGAAADAGADALIAMPPYTTPGSPELIFQYYERLGRAVDLPLIVQNPPPPFASLGTDHLVALVERVPSITLVKEETLPNPQRVGRLIEASGARRVGVMGGLGGLYLFNELSRGAAGTMPACQFTDVVADILAAYDQGNVDAARFRFSALLPALVLERLYGMTFMKVCLQRRGVIESAATRVPEPPLDRFDMTELDAIWAGLAPFFRVHLSTAAHPGSSRRTG